MHYWGSRISLGPRFGAPWPPFTLYFGHFESQSAVIYIDFWPKKCLKEPIWPLKGENVPFWGLIVAQKPCILRLFGVF